MDSRLCAPQDLKPHKVTDNTDEESAFSAFDGAWKEATLSSSRDTPLILSWRILLKISDHLRSRAQASYTQLFSDYALPLSHTAPTTNKPAPAESSRVISYDALRGLACVAVFNMHFVIPYTETIVYGFGVPTRHGPNVYFHQLPIIRLWAGGTPAVCLFFGISGYVLSGGFLAGVRKSQHDKAIARLSSLALRRWFRLFLPATVSMFLVMIGSWLGLYDNWGRYQDLAPWMTGTPEPHPLNKGSLFANLLQFAATWCEWMNLSKRRYWSSYDPHTWTLPVEFRGSMVLFILLLISLKLRPRVRTAVFGLVSAYFYLAARWEYGMFVGGAFIADLHQNLNDKSRDVIALPVNDNASKARPLERQSRRKSAVSDWLLFVVGLYVLSFPCTNGEETLGYILIGRLTPPGTPEREVHFFWHSMAAMLLLWSIERLSSLRTILSTRFFQYFGEISFSLYLVHGPLLHSVGYALMPKLWSITGNATTREWMTGLVLGWMIMLSMCIAVAHVFNKLVDVPLVKATRQLEVLLCERA